MIKWTKFLESDGSEVTYFNDQKVLQSTEGMQHGFTSVEEALEKSTTEVFIFWDSVPAGVGLVQE